MISEEIHRRSCLMEGSAERMAVVSCHYVFDETLNIRIPCLGNPVQFLIKLHLVTFEAISSASSSSFLSSFRGIPSILLLA